MSTRDFARGVIGAVVCLAAGAAAALAQSREAPTLRLIGTNDFHGALEARPDLHGRLWGGAVALAGAIHQARSECVAPSCYSVLLDAGDEFQGQAPSTLARGKPVSLIFNALGVDAAALGNHDLDWGRDTLRLREADEHYPVLSANLRYDDGRPVEWVKPDTILRRGPFVIGVIGIMTLEAETAIAAGNLTGLRFVDPVPIVDSLARDLRRRGANVVVVVAHAGGNCGNSGNTACRGEILDDARRFTQKIDAIIAGHSHTFINTTVAGIPVTSALMSGQAIDVVDLALNGRTVRTAHQDVRRVFADSFPADTAIARMVAAAVAAIGPRLAAPVAVIGDDMEKTGSDNAVCRLIADGMRAAGHADFAAMNSGGVRAPLRAGVATYSTVFDIQPFGNRLVMLTGSGAAMRKYFERMVSGRGPTACISGGTVTVDTTRPAGSRVVSITLPDGKRFDDSATYTVVINDFMSTGGDALAFPDSTAPKRDLPGQDIDATIAYLRAAPSPVRAPAEARWIILPSPARPEE